jgi:hypothetical protein
MAFPIKQENYNLAPTAEQNKVFVEAWRMNAADIARARELQEPGSSSSPLTRIGAHFLIRHILGLDSRITETNDILRAGIRKRQLKEWREAREIKRAARRAALAQVEATAAQAAGR